jgi:hypothetical protein
MSTIDDAAEVIGRYVHPDFAEDAARALAAEGHLAPEPDDHPHRGGRGRPPCPPPGRPRGGGGR